MEICKYFKLLMSYRNLYLKDKYGEPSQCNLLERTIDGKTTSLNMCSSGQKMLGFGIGLHGNVTIKYALLSSESPNSNVTYLKIFTPNFNETILLLPVSVFLFFL